MKPVFEVFKTPHPPLFSYLHLSDDTGYHYPSSADIFHLCMCIKNFCWTERGKNVLKIEEGRGGCMVHLEMVSECV